MNAVLIVVAMVAFGGIALAVYFGLFKLRAKRSTALRGASVEDAFDQDLGITRSTSARRFWKSSRMGALEDSTRVFGWKESRRRREAMNVEAHEADQRGSVATRGTTVKSG